MIKKIMGLFSSKKIQSNDFLPLVIKHPDLKKTFVRLNPVVKSPVVEKFVIKKPFEKKSSNAVKTVLEKRLIVACLGDSKKADRLIHFELNRADISFSVAVDRALERLESDRR